MLDPFDTADMISKMINPNCDEVLEKKQIDEHDEKPEVSRQFYCHGCNTWQPCKNDFEPYDCPLCHHSRYGD